MRRVPTLLLRLALVTVPLAAARAGGVRIVEPTGTQNFADIQSAVNAAPQNAVLLVGAGTYPGFTLSAKSLSILAVSGADVRIVGGVTVSNIAFNQTVVMCGLEVERSAGINPVPALDLVDSAGHMRFQDCTFQALDHGELICEMGPGPGLDGGPGVRISSCAKVAFTHCALIGGKGMDRDEWGNCTDFLGGGDGGAGLVAFEANVIVYDCQVAGNVGGYGRFVAGAGAHGATIDSTNLFASATTFLGGDGGAVQSTNGHGPGGAGAYIGSSSTANEIGCAFQGGLCGNCAGGQSPPTGGGPVNSIQAVARRAVVTPVVQGDAATWSVAYDGAPNDRPFLFSSYSPNTQIYLPFHGAWLTLRAALLAPATLGQADATGSVDRTVATPDLPPGSLYERRFSQIVVRGAGQVYLGSGAVLYVLDRQSGPDCNGNGVSDFVDVIEGASADANHNLIPDSCAGG